MRTVAEEEAARDFDLLLDAVTKGEEIIILRNNLAVARIVRELPAPTRPAPRLGMAAGQVWMAEDFDATPEDFADYL